MYRGATGLVREKALEVSDDPVLRAAGFQFDVPLSVLGPDYAGHVRVFALHGAEATELRVTRAARWLNEVFWRREGDALLGSDGRRASLSGEGLSGRVDMARYDGDKLRILGWAADLEALAHVESIVVLRDGEHLHSGPTWIERANVAEHFRAPALTNAGFHFWLPLRWFGDPPEGAVEVIALAGDRALSLAFAPDAAWITEGLQARPPDGGEGAREDG